MRNWLHMPGDTVRMVAVGLLWSCLLGLSLAWNVWQQRQQTMTLATNAARTAFDKDMALRRWITSHGGIYVPATPRTPPNPYLTQLPERDITTPSGVALTLMNPAYVIRQLQQEHPALFGIQGRLVSETPINPVNQPDAWESAALHTLRQGAAEVVAVTQREGEPYLRLMRPMLIREGCLKCHPDELGLVGEFRGGVGVLLPMKGFFQGERQVINGLMLTHGAIWLLGLGALGGYHHLTRIRLREKRRAREALRAAEARFDSMANASPVGVFFTDVEGNCEYVNDTWCAMTGMDNRQARGSGWGNALHPADREKVFRQWQACAAEQKPLQSTYRIQRPDGGVIWVQGEAVPRRNPRGEVIGYVGTITDISVRKEMERALKDSEARMTSLLNSSGEAIYGIDRDGVCTFCNPSCIKLLGYEHASDLLGHNMHQLAHYSHADGAPYPEERCGTYLAFTRNRGVHVDDEVFWRADGTSFPVEYRSHPLIQDGHVVGAVVNFTDVSQRKAMEAGLREAKARAEAATRAKSEFLAAMSHEIRTPMNSVMGMAELLAEAELPPDVQHYVAALRRNSEALLALINDVLDFSKVELGHLSLHPEPFDARELVMEVTGAFTVLVREKDVNLGAEWPEGLARWRHGDSLRLRQVLVNLVGNAVKFTHAGRVTVSVAEEGPERLRFSVTDTGIGVPEALRESIFEAFTQGDGSVTRRYGGTGLGLALSRHLVTLMGGEIWLEVGENGQGSRFQFTAALPPVAHREEPVHPQARPPSNTSGLPPQWGQDPLQGRRILLVEDAPDNVLLMRAFLQRYGVEIDVAEDGEEALRRYGAGQYDLVLMDIQMPILDGYAATRAIRALEAQEERPRVPIVALTAYALAGDAEKSLEAGCDDHLAKPITKARLVKTLTHWLGTAPP